MTRKRALEIAGLLGTISPMAETGPWAGTPLVSAVASADNMSFRGAGTMLSAFL
jgi:hypothetical protein